MSTPVREGQQSSHLCRRSCQRFGASRFDIGERPEWTNFSSADALSNVEGLISPPDPPSLDLVESDDPPEWEMDEDLRQMLENLGEPNHLIVEEAAVPPVAA